MTPDQKKLWEKSGASYKNVLADELFIRNVVFDVVDERKNAADIWSPERWQYIMAFNDEKEWSSFWNISQVNWQLYYLNTYMKFVTRLKEIEHNLSSCIINGQISCKRFIQQKHFYVIGITPPVKTHDIPPLILWHVFPPMTNKMGEIQLCEASVRFVWLKDCQWLLPVHPAEVWSTSKCSSRISCHRQPTVKTSALLKGPAAMMKLHFPKTLIKTPLSRNTKSKMLIFKKR